MKKRTYIVPSIVEIAINSEKPFAASDNWNVDGGAAGGGETKGENPPYIDSKENGGSLWDFDEDNEDY